MDILENNLEKLSKINPGLAQEIKNHTSFTKEIQINETKCGDVNIIYDGLPIHDDIDALDEAKQLVSDIQMEESGINVFMGLGLGYHIDLAIQKSPSLMVVIEPNLDILRVTFQVLDMTPLFESGHFILLRDYNLLKESVSDLIKKDTEFSLKFLPSSYQMFPEILNSLKEEINILTGLVKIAYNTVDENLQLWTSTFALNFYNIFRHKEVEALRNKFKNKPALIVSAGPSLDKTIELIKQHQDKFIIFCVGTAAKALYSNNITPDFVVLIEAGACHGQIDRLEIQNLITIPSSHHELHIAEHKRTWNYYPNNMPETQWMKKAGFIDFDIDDYKNSGSVSFIAFFSAIIAGCNPIILTGQDLAFSDGQCYSKDASYKVKCQYDNETDSYKIQPENYDDYISANINNDDKNSLKEYLVKTFDKASENIYFVEGQDGKKIPTNGGYVTFIKYFEEIGRNYKDKLTLINCSSGGAQLNGFENLLFEDACEKYATQNIETEKIIDEALANFRNNEEFVPIELCEEVRSLIKTNLDLKPIINTIKLNANKVKTELKRRNAVTHKVQNYFKKTWNAYLQLIKTLKKLPFLSTLLSKLTKKLDEEIKDALEKDDIVKINKISEALCKYTDDVKFNSDNMLNVYCYFLSDRNSRQETFLKL